MSSGCKGCEPKTAVMKSDGFRMDKVVVQKVLRDCKKSFKKIMTIWYFCGILYTNVYGG